MRASGKKKAVEEGREGKDRRVSRTTGARIFHMLDGRHSSSSSSSSRRSHMRVYAQGQGQSRSRPPATHARLLGARRWRFSRYIYLDRASERQIRARVTQLFMDSRRGVFARKPTLSRAPRLMITAPFVGPRAFPAINLIR